MGDQDRLQDDLMDLGGIRGVVLEGSPKVQTVPEPPTEPAQPPPPSEADSGDDS